MPLILRTRPTAPVTVPTLRRRSAIVGSTALSKETAAPKRQLRFATSNNAAKRAELSKAARDEIDTLLQSVATEEAALDEAAAKLEKLHSQIEAQLRGANLTEHSDGTYKASIEETFSRQSRTIDPKKFKNAVGDTAFWGSIKVGVTEAKQFLSEREMDQVADTVPAKSLGYSFKLKKIERKTK